MQREISVVHQQKSDTTQSWETINPILKDSEFGIEIDNSGNRKAKIGDGTTPWNDLPYFPYATNGGGNGTPGGIVGHFVYTFNATTDWVGTVPPFSFTISGGSHPFGENVSANLSFLVNGNYEQSFGFPTNGYTLRVSSGGVVTIIAEQRFAGRIILTSETLVAGLVGGTIYSFPGDGIPSTDLETGLQNRIALIDGIVDELAKKVDETNTITINGDAQQLGNNPEFMIGGGGGGKYSHTFDDDGSWTGDGPFVISVPEDIHEAGNNISVSVYFLRDNKFVKTLGFPNVGYTVEIDFSGNVELIANERFAGKMFITS